MELRYSAIGGSPKTRKRKGNHRDVIWISPKRRNRVNLGLTSFRSMFASLFNRGILTRWVYWNKWSKQVKLGVSFLYWVRQSIASTRLKDKPPLSVEGARWELLQRHLLPWRPSNPLGDVFPPFPALIGNVCRNCHSSSESCPESTSVWFGNNSSSIPTQSKSTCGLLTFGFLHKQGLIYKRRLKGDRWSRLYDGQGKKHRKIDVMETSTIHLSVLLTCIRWNYSRTPSTWRDRKKGIGLVQCRFLVSCAVWLLMR